LKLLNWPKFLHKIRLDPVKENETDENTDDLTIATISCRQVIRSIAFGQLNKRSIRPCGRPLSAGFHRVLNFPSETGTGHIVATGYQSGGIDLWEVETCKRLISLVDHKDSVREVRFAPNGSLLLLSSSTDETLKIWDCQDDGNLVKTLKLKKRQHSWLKCAWSPDARMVVGACSTMCTWDVANISVDNRKCPLLKHFEGHYNEVMACAFSPDGLILLSGGKDCLLILWDAHDASMLRLFRSCYPCPTRFSMSLQGGPQERSMIVDCLFSADGNHVTAVCGDGTLRVWDILGDDDPVQASFLENPVSCAQSAAGGDTGESAVIAVGRQEGTVALFSHPPATVSSLQHLARMSFRKHKSPISMDLLNMPNSVKKYLHMDDLWRGCDCESDKH